MKPQENVPSTELQASPVDARLPYRAPTLRRLGSVRELTLGTGTKMPDTAGQLTGKFM